MVENISKGNNLSSQGMSPSDKQSDLDVSVNSDKGSGRSDSDFKKVASLLFQEEEIGILKLLKSWEKKDIGKLSELADMGVDDLLNHVEDGERIQGVEENPKEQFKKGMMQDIKKLEKVLALDPMEIRKLQELFKSKGPLAVFKKIEAKLSALIGKGNIEARAFNRDEKKIQNPVLGFIISNICSDAADVLHLTLENLQEYDISEKLKGSLERLRDEKEALKAEIEHQIRSQDAN